MAHNSVGLLQELVGGISSKGFRRRCIVAFEELVEGGCEVRHCVCWKVESLY